MTTTEFFNACKGHDWFHQFSDDHSVYTRGQRRESELRTLTEGNRAFAAIFAAWRSYNYSGPAFGSERAPLPELATFECDESHTSTAANQLAYLP